LRGRGESGEKAELMEGRKSKKRCDLQFIKAAQKEGAGKAKRE